MSVNLDSEPWECPPGAVFVIDSRKDPRAASAGPETG